MYGEALVLIRKYKSLKAGELALKLGISCGYLSSIENNRRDTALPILHQYADFLGVKLWSLLAFIEAVPLEDDVLRPPMCDKMHKILVWVREVNEFKKCAS